MRTSTPEEKIATRVDGGHSSLKDSFESRLEQAQKSCLLEMVVGGQCLRDAAFSHEDETDGVTK
jgi:hypothetical protein